MTRRFQPDKGDVALIVMDFQDGVLAAVGDLISDAVCSRRKSDWEVSLRMAEQAGGVVTSTEIIAFQLLQCAGTAEFKVMSPLLRDALHELEMDEEVGTGYHQSLAEWLKRVQAGDLAASGHLWVSRGQGAGRDGGLGGSKVGSYRPPKRRWRRS